MGEFQGSFRGRLRNPETDAGQLSFGVEWAARIPPRDRMRNSKVLRGSRGGKA
jgi:hypothetical protein